MEKQSQPIIGFIGLFLTLVFCPAGLCMAGQNNGLVPGIVCMLIGPVVLVYALFTGNVKLFG